MSQEQERLEAVVRHVVRVRAFVEAFERLASNGEVDPVLSPGDATIAMVAVPAIVMLLMNNLILDRLFTFQTAGDKMLWAGIAGLCSVQCVVIAFLVAAFRDDGGETPKTGAGAEQKKAQ